MNLKATALVIATVFSAVPALPCSFIFPVPFQNGPLQFQGRVDVPTNWVWVGHDLNAFDSTTSYWMQRLPDGEIERLEVDIGNDFFRVFPRDPVVEGETYVVRSYNGDALPESVVESGDLNADNAAVSFTIGREDTTAPAAPPLERIEASEHFDPINIVDTCHISRDDTRLSFVLRPDSEIAFLALRRVDTDRIVASSAAITDGTLVTLEHFTPDSGGLPYEVIAFDFAGHQSAAAAVVDAGCAGACSSTGSALPFWALLGALFIAPRLRHRRRR